MPTKQLQRLSAKQQENQEVDLHVWTCVPAVLVTVKNCLPFAEAGSRRRAIDSDLVLPERFFAGARAIPGESSSV